MVGATCAAALRALIQHQGQSFIYRPIRSPTTLRFSPFFTKRKSTWRYEPCTQIRTLQAKRTWPSEKTLSKVVSDSFFFSTLFFLSMIRHWALKALKSVSSVKCKSSWVLKLKHWQKKLQEKNHNFIVDASKTWPMELAYRWAWWNQRPVLLKLGVNVWGRLKMVTKREKVRDKLFKGLRVDFDAFSVKKNYFIRKLPVLISKNRK